MRKAPQKKSPISSLTLPALLAVLIVACIVAVGKSDILHGSEEPPAGKVDGAVKHFDGLEQTLLPAGTTSQIIDYKGYTVSFNADNGTPNYAAWELLGTETDGPVSRSNRFWTDEKLNGCPDTKDYTRSGFDRGHLCPAADMKWSAQSMEDCFSMANMCPQAHSLNAGAWKTLEEKERLWAKRDSALVIVAGPIYQPDDKLRIGNSGVRVPSSFFKVIIAPYLCEPRGIAFIYPNDRCPGNMKNYMVTIDEVERITGYDFFYRLPDEIEDQIEAKSSFKAWEKY